jgi:diguanylate cyclase (GGDEF)-like protein
MTRSYPPHAAWRGLWARPEPLVERTRWLFLMSVVLSLVLTVATVTPAPGSLPSLILPAALGVLLSAAGRYLGKGRGLLWDVLDVVAVAALAAALVTPVAAFPVVFASAWARAVHGRGAVLHTAGLIGAVVVATTVWPTLPGHAGGDAPWAPVLGALPCLVVAAFVAGHLTQQLFAREQSRQRDQALATLGTHLLGLTDRARILEHAGAAYEAICAATPGLRAVVVRVGPALEPLGHAGPFLQPPPPLPRDMLPADPCALPEYPVVPAPALTAAAGASNTWLAIPVSRAADTVLLLGAGDQVPGECVVAARSLNNQVALALQACAAHAELRTQALTDPLTGLANRAAFTAALDSETERVADGEAQSWALFVDLDDFKRVNDELGHAAGDRLLQAIGRRLAATVRDGDVCARLGGDEFAVLLRNADEDDARGLGARLVTAASTPVDIDGRPARVGASVGAARLDPVGVVATLQCADVAMYSAKAAGKNRVEVYSSVAPAPSPGATCVREHSGAL